MAIAIAVAVAVAVAVAIAVAVAVVNKFRHLADGHLQDSEFFKVG